MAGETTLNHWIDTIRRARISRSATLVALMMATWASKDGTRVYPGISRLALSCKISYNTAQSALGELRAAGLIRVTAKATGRHHADEYRLVIDAQPNEPVEVWTADRMADEIAAMIETHRGKHRKPPAAVGRAAVPTPPAEPELHPKKRGADSSALHPSQLGAEPEAAPQGLGCAAPNSERPAPQITGCAAPQPVGHQPPFATTSSTTTIAMPGVLGTIAESLAITGEDATEIETRAILRLIVERHRPRSPKYYTKIAAESGFTGYLAEVRAAASEERSVVAAKRYAELATMPECPHGQPGGLEHTPAGQPRCPLCRRGLPVQNPQHPPMPEDQRAVADAYRHSLLACGPPPLDLILRVATVANQAKEFLARGAAPEVLTPYAEIAGRTGTDLTTAIRHGSPT